MASSNLAPSSDRRLVSLARILKVLREAPDPAQRINALLDNLLQEFHPGLLWLGFYDPRRHTLNGQGYRASATLAHQVQGLLRRELTLTPGDLLEQVVIQQRSLAVNDLRNEPLAGTLKPLGEKLGIQGSLLMPVRHQDVCHGVLFLGSSQWGQTLRQPDFTYLATVLGALGASLAQDKAQEQASRQRPEAVTLGVIGQLATQPSLEERLGAIAQALHGFIRPHRTRILWFDPQQFSLWERASLGPKDKRVRSFTPETTPLTLPPVQVRGLYHSLGDGAIAVAEMAGLVVRQGPEEVMGHLKIQALLAAPIYSQGGSQNGPGELQGILWAEETQPRLWDREAKTLITALAQLLGLAGPVPRDSPTALEPPEETPWVPGLLQRIDQEADWHHTLKTCAQQVCDRLQADQCLLLLQPDPQSPYHLEFRGGPGAPHRAQPLGPWAIPDPIDQKLLGKSPSAIPLADISQELKFLPWREQFTALGLQSSLISNLTPGASPTALLIVGSATPRHWTTAECQFLYSLSGSLGLLLHQWQLRQVADQQQELYQVLQHSLHTLLGLFDLEELPAIACEQLATLLQVPFVALLHWQPGAEAAQVNPVLSQRPDFTASSPNITLPLGDDALIQSALVSDRPLLLPWNGLPPATQAWLTAPSSSQWVALALRTAPHHIPTGVLLVGAGGDRPWSPTDLELLQLLGRQLAWGRRHLAVVNRSYQHHQHLQQITWYHHHQLGEIQGRLQSALQTLDTLGTPTPQELARLQQRQQLLARSLKGLSHDLETLSRQSPWQLPRSEGSLSLASLLNRLMEQVRPQVRQRQLWAKVHNEYSKATVKGDIPRLEFVLREVLQAACGRSPEQGRVDIWCRLEAERTIELSITDDGVIPPAVLSALQAGRGPDLLQPSPLDDPPWRSLLTCQTILAELGLACSFHQLEDDRTLSRLLLPIQPLSPPP